MCCGVMILPLIILSMDIDIYMYIDNIWQEASWDLELSPKTSCKLLPENNEITPSNVSNNNNDIAMWGCTRETNNSVWSAWCMGYCHC